MRFYADTRTKQRGRKGYFFVSVALACAVLSCLWFFGANHSTIEAWAVLPRPSEGRLPYVTVGNHYGSGLDTDTLDWQGNTISEALGEPVDNVQSGAFLVTVAHVYGSHAEPIRGAKVSFTLSSEAGSWTSIDRTNTKGTASCMRWIPAEAQGKPMIVTAEATSNGWIGAGSKWFVPE